MENFSNEPVFHMYMLYYVGKYILSILKKIYELPHELPNDLRLRILGNKKRSEKYQNIIEL